MFRSKNILWITFAFCVTTGSCADFFQKSGQEVKMDCADANSNTEIEWKLNSLLVLGKSKSGLPRKGRLDTTSRARIDGTMLKISSLRSSDAGIYTCKSSSHTLYVASAGANPSSVLYSKETKLSCDITGDFKGTFHWLTPRNEPYAQSKDVTVKSVTSDNAGPWTCQIKNKIGVEVIKLKVDVSVVGPLNISGEVKISEGGTAELQCFLPGPISLPIKGGTWTRDPPSGVRFPALTRKQNAVYWNSTNVSTENVIFSDHELKEDFSVKLKKVKHDDAGVYVCSLVFEGGKYLNAKLNLTVLKRDGVSPDMDSNGSKVTKNMWHKRVWGLPVWVWVVMSFIVVIALVAIILLLHYRNKRMKKKMKKLKSKQQPLTSKKYCNCARTVRQPGTGKRERPPPLPRHQYSSLNE